MANLYRVFVRGHRNKALVSKKPPREFYTPTNQVIVIVSNPPPGINMSDIANQWQDADKPWWVIIS
jgi:hypothetical protein